MIPALDFRDVSFAYRAGERCLSGLSFAVQPGEFVCVRGRNGSGKSTLARLANGLLVPDSGSVRVFGNSTREAVESAAAGDSAALLRVRSDVGLVFQNPEDQIVAGTVEQDVAFGPENLGLPPSEIRHRIARALEAVAMTGFEAYRIDELSGGQKQRVAIAGVLALRPRVLVLDEAASMLDPMGREGFLRVLKRLRDDGMAIVSITHDPEETAFADRVIELRDGRIAFEGAPSAFSRMCEQRASEWADDFDGGSSAPADGGEISCSAQSPYHGDTAGSAHAGWGRDADGIHGAVMEEALDVSFRYGKAKRRTSGIRKGTGERRTVPTRCAGSGVSSECAPSQVADKVPGLALGIDDTKRGAEALRATRHSGCGEDSSPRWGNDPSEPWVLQELNLKLRAGEVMGIAGHTGSGKSTVLSLLAGQLHPTKGRILLDGADLADKHTARSACTKVGIVFQRPEMQLFAPTVAEDIAFGPRNLGLSDADVEERVSAALVAVGLPKDLRERSPFELSGGQQRRVAIAGVLAMRPSILLMDEPSAGLDDEGRARLIRLIAMQRDEGRAIAVVTHDMELLSAIADRVMVLNEGFVYAIGVPEEVLAPGAGLERIGLRSPYGEETRKGSTR